MKALSALAAVLALSASLAACVSDEAWNEEMGAYDVVEIAQNQRVSLEKRLLRGLSDIKADDSQRAAVLAAYDRMQAEHRRIDSRQSELQGARNALDARDAGYLAAINPLLSEEAQLQLQRNVQLAEFRHAAATSLTASQWQALQESLREQQREGGLRRPGRRR